MTISSIQKLPRITLSHDESHGFLFLEKGEGYECFCKSFETASQRQRG